MRGLRLAVVTIALAVLAAGCPPPPPPPTASPPAPTPGLPAPPPDIALPANSPTLTTNQTFITASGGVNLDHPWDISFTPSGTGLFTERPGRISSFDPSTGVTKLVGSVANTYANGESGLLGIAVDPAFGTTNTFIYVCVSSTVPSLNNQVRRFTVNLSAAAGAGLSGETVMLQGMPVANFHDGCRVRFQPGTTPPALWVTMGDAGTGPGPQDLTSLAGKILRTRVDTGTLLEPYPGNPFAADPKPKSLIYTYGHRNPQGIAFQPGTNTPYNSEHGPSINDEVNKLVSGGNAGWDPNTNGSYDQSHSMTDLAKFPDAVLPAWRSGDTFTLAPSGAAFLAGTQWKSWEGALVVAFLKDSRLRVMFLDAPGSVTGAYPTLAVGSRLRSVVQGPDGSLYIATDNGSPNDRIWKVTPS